MGLYLLLDFMSRVCHLVGSDKNIVSLLATLGGRDGTASTTDVRQAQPRILLFSVRIYPFYPLSDSSEGT